MASGSGSTPRIRERRRECASGGRKIPARTRSRRSCADRNAVSSAHRSASASRSTRRVAYTRIDFHRAPSVAGDPDTAPAHSAKASIRSSASTTSTGGTRGDAKRGVGAVGAGNGEGSAPISHASICPEKRQRSSGDWSAIGNRVAACSSSGTGVDGRHPTTFPPVAVFQRVATPEGLEATPAANRIPSVTARARTGSYCLSRNNVRDLVIFFLDRPLILLRKSPRG
jgi:hypothetical protein